MAYRRHANENCRRSISSALKLPHRSGRESEAHECVCCSLLELIVRSRDTNAREYSPNHSLAQARWTDEESRLCVRLAVGAYEGRYPKGPRSSPAVPSWRDINQSSSGSPKTTTIGYEAMPPLALSLLSRGGTKAVAPSIEKDTVESHTRHHPTRPLLRSLVRSGSRKRRRKPGVASHRSQSYMRESGTEHSQDQSLQRWNGWEIARQAAEVLGELAFADPAVSIPVLIEGLGSTNREDCHCIIPIAHQVQRNETEADSPSPEESGRANAGISPTGSKVRTEYRSILRTPGLDSKSDTARIVQ